MSFTNKERKGERERGVEFSEERRGFESKANKNRVVFYLKKKSLIENKFKPLFRNQKFAERG